jgi:hypothetical protein
MISTSLQHKRGCDAAVFGAPCYFQGLNVIRPSDGRLNLIAFVAG